MSLFRSLKELFLLPLSRRVPTVLLGSVDQWAIPTGSLVADSFIVSAGVGHSITFEQDIVARFGAKVVLLDPSPTGVATIERLSDRRNIEFMPLGLAAASGELRFGLPDRADEGSFRKGSAADGVSFGCTTLSDIMRQHGRTRIDLLKIDVEGFEYEIIQSIFDNHLSVEQICVEIHHNREISIDQTVADAARLIFRLARHGYRVVYNKNMDFTFVKTGLLAGMSGASGMRLQGAAE